MEKFFDRNFYDEWKNSIKVIEYIINWFLQLEITMDTALNTEIPSSTILESVLIRFNECSGGRRSLEIIPIVIRKNIKCSRNVSYVVHDTGMQHFVSLLHMLYLLVKKGNNGLEGRHYSIVVNSSTNRNFFSSID